MCASQHVCLQVCLQGLQQCSRSFGLLPEEKLLSHTRTVLALCSPLPSHCFAKPQTQLTQRLNYLEAQSWRSSSSSAASTSSTQGFPSTWTCQLLALPLPSPFGSLALVSPAQRRMHKKSAYSSTTGPEENPQLSFSEDRVGSIYSYKLMFFLFMTIAENISKAEE